MHDGSTIPNLIARVDRAIARIKDAAMTANELREKLYLTTLHRDYLLQCIEQTGDEYLKAQADNFDPSLQLNKEKHGTDQPYRSSQIVLRSGQQPSGGEQGNDGFLARTVGRGENGVLGERGAADRRGTVPGNSLETTSTLCAPTAESRDGSPRSQSKEGE